MGINIRRLTPAVKQGEEANYDFTIEVPPAISNEAIESNLNKISGVACAVNPGPQHPYASSPIKNLFRAKLDKQLGSLRTLFLGATGVVITFIFYLVNNQPSWQVVVSITVERGSRGLSQEPLGSNGGLGY